jgi:DnaJ-class molecular chaperone
MNIDIRRWNQLNEALIDLQVCGFVTSSEETRIGARLDRARQNIVESPCTATNTARDAICPTCHGKGFDVSINAGILVECSTCNGSGQTAPVA